MSEKLTTNEARQGRTAGNMRYVLIGSTALAVIALLLVFLVV